MAGYTGKYTYDHRYRSATNVQIGIKPESRLWYGLKSFGERVALADDNEDQDENEERYVVPDINMY